MDRRRIIVTVAAVLVVLVLVVAWRRRRQVPGGMPTTSIPPVIVADQWPVCGPGERLLKTYPATLNESDSGLCGLRIDLGA